MEHEEGTELVIAITADGVVEQNTTEEGEGS